MTNVQTKVTETKVTLNTVVTTTSVTQTANEVLGTKEKKLYYLIIKNSTGESEIINVGEKTHNKILKLTQ